MHLLQTANDVNCGNVQWLEWQLKLTCWDMEEIGSAILNIVADWIEKSALANVIVCMEELN